MITQTITYDDFNGESQTDLVNFHISKAVLADHLAMRDQLLELQQILSGDPRTLKADEIQKIIDVVKFFIKISYGVKSDDGKRFVQDDPAGSGPVFEDFRTSAAYNTFLMSLFEDPEAAIMFILALLPQDLREEAEKEMDDATIKALKDLEKATRPEPGSKISEDGIVTTPAEQGGLRAVPPIEASTDDEEDVDFDALLKEANAIDPNEGKTPITQDQSDFMQRRLQAKPGQFEKFMSTHYVPEDSE